MSVFDYLSDEDLEKILFADKFFLRRRTFGEKENLLKTWLEKISRSIITFPEYGRFKILYFRSMPRNDYKQLFHAMIDSVGEDDHVVIEDFEESGGRINLQISQYITSNIKIMNRLQSDCSSERMLCTLKLCYYGYIVELLANYDVEVATFFSDMQPVEHMASLYFKAKGITTVTLQHGLYIDYKGLDTVNVINYLHQPSDYFLAWGENTKKLIEKYHRDSKVVVCGKPNIFPIKEVVNNRLKKFVVIMDQEIFKEKNSEMIHFAIKLSREKGLSFGVKYHPHNNKAYYKKLYGELDEVMTLRGADFVIGHTSSLLYEWMASGGGAFQYTTEVPTINIEKKFQFRTYDELSLKLLEIPIEQGFSSKHNKEIKYIGDKSRSKYRAFYDKLLKKSMREIPLFSIIIPTFNSVFTINRCLDSLVEQTFKKFEVIIVDGCSNDMTLPVVANYENSDRRIKIYSEPDENVYDAMNKGIEKAKGQWLYFMGSDDELYNEHVLEKIAKCTENTSAGMIYGSVKLVGDVKWAKDGTVYDGEFTKEKIQEKNICHQAIFYKADVLRKMGGYNINYRVCADWDMNLRFWAESACHYTDCIVANFYSGGTSTEGGDPVFGKDFKKIKEDLFAEYDR